MQKSNEELKVFNQLQKEQNFFIHFFSKYHLCGASGKKFYLKHFRIKKLKINSRNSSLNNHVITIY